MLVLEFWPPPNEEDGLGSQFERSLALARYLASERLNDVRTVAYLPRSVLGHAVLPVMACEEIIMHPDAELGAAGHSEGPITPAIRGAYSEIANRRRTIPAAVALGMLDRDLKVLKVTTPTGTRYVLSDDLPALQEEVAVQAIDTMVPAGDLGRFTGLDLRLQHGFVSHVASERRELAEKLGIKMSSLEPDPSAGGQWNPIRVDLAGPVSATSTNRIKRGVEEQLRQGTVNLICVAIDSPGGDLAASLDLAIYLAELDSSQVRTVAYVSGQALGDAALVSLGCDHLVMHTGAVLGGPVPTNPLRKSARICRFRCGRSVAIRLAIGPCRPRCLTLSWPCIATNWRAVRSSNISARKSWSSKPIRANGGRAKKSPRPGKPLSLTGERAEELGLARFAVDNFAEFKRLYELENDPALVEPSWVDDLIDYLAAPQVAASLLFFAGFALMMELSSPGLGVGGFVAAVCFVLFFWSQFLDGTADWLEILLFLTGVACVAIEIFVIPGFGVFGMGGGLLMIAALVLASQTFIFPRNEYQMNQFPRSLMMVLAAGGGVGAGLVVLRKFMDRAPILRRIILTSARWRAARGSGSQREALVDFGHLLGQVGMTISPLVPAGKARFGNDFVSVISDGDIVPKGTPVRVTSVTGNRVEVVAESDSAGTPSSSDEFVARGYVRWHRWCGHCC